MVLYFFPKAFTPGCNLEAKAFAEAIDDFKRAGAQVVGMSGDTLEDLAEFSTKECARRVPGRARHAGDDPGVRRARSTATASATTA